MYCIHFACRELLGVGYVEILILHHSLCVLCLFLASKCQHGRAYIGQCLIRVYTQAALNNVFQIENLQKICRDLPVIGS
jgi:hypothetical protein